MAVQRRYLSLAAAGLTTAMTLSLSACGGSADGGDVTLKLVAADYGDTEANSSQHYWDKLVKDFEKQNPNIKVEVSVYSWKDVDKKVEDMVKSGKAPDMAQIGAYADYAAAGKLYSADQLLSIPVHADFVPALAEAGEYQRIQYGMPFGASTRRLFYNKKLFAEAGIANPPQTWADIAADAAKLKAKGVKMPYALPLGPEETQAETLMWMLSGGGSYTDSIGKYTIDSPQNVKTFEWLKKDLVGPGLTGTDPAKLNRQDAFNAFAAGDVGMLNGHPTLMKQAEAKGIDYGTVELPGPSGKAKATMGVADWMTAFKQNGHRDQVGKFLDFVYNEKNVMDFSGEYGLLPVTTSGSQAMLANSKYAKLHSFLGQLAQAEFYPANKTSWPMVSKTVKAKMGTAVGANGNPAGVLSDIQNAANEADNAGQ
ncbi:extracellular solute-binding protein [Streptomyces rimosus]|nr:MULTISPECIES: extracellular solute-binding protein [Streptomyces]UNZ03708.1 Multiple sugar-binding protein precursor [Streptomyces rimosus subsp. rimosus]UTH95216.1 Multiple sugar-binding protein precursor [Streptomyces rimosus subsp. rimosus]UTJ13313.1 Multiple sugar-binding protein precursor [Streptomyces rimosus subsp. rimosus]